jgi:5-formyltetrahydrofolate cyclo-ligase
MMTKEQIRIRMKERRNALSMEERLASNRAILKQLCTMKEFVECESLFTYVSFQSEVDTRAMINAALEDKKCVYVPRIEKQEGHEKQPVMNFYRIDSCLSLVKNKLGIPEPARDDERPYRMELQEEKSTSLMLLPGLAFDRSGNRIGYGGGYYDWYLRNGNQKCFTKIALAYEFQIIERIAAEPYDVKADYIITPAKIITCS